MKIRMFYHSLISSWNHGNAHFLRGIQAELLKLGHDVLVYEPENGWSLMNLLQDQPGAIGEFKEHFPELRSSFYDPRTADLDQLLKDTDLVIVHEWNDHDLVQRIGRHRARNSYRLFFHDTHHRAVSQPEEMRKYDLSGYDAVLAFGGSLVQVYEQHHWARRVFNWHEAADTNTHFPTAQDEKEGDLVWIGNWGDDERSEELEEFIIRPVRELGLKAVFHGVRYPEHALKKLKEAGITYGGYLPAHQVTETFGRYRSTVHVPRRFYTESLPGIPTIRPFEAMACKVPLLSAPWNDSEGLFTVGKDLIMVKDGHEMKQTMQWLLADPARGRELAGHAHQTIMNRHTCGHRVQELLRFHEQVLQDGPIEINSIQ